MEMRYKKKSILFTGVFFLVTILSLWIFLFRPGFNEFETLADYHSSTTPTPYPLPTRVVHSPPRILSVIRQVIGIWSNPMNPMTIFKNGRLQTESDHLKLLKTGDYIPIEIDWWLYESEQVYEYISRRLNITLDGKMVVTFIQPETGKCDPRGKTYHEEETLIIIYANTDTSKEQILAVLAHEMSHGLLNQKFPHLNDNALIEGITTWAAGDYWESWKRMDFNATVIAAIGDGTYLPLSQNFDMKKAYDDTSLNCLVNRDLLLTELASFLDYLKSHYGEEKLTILFDNQLPNVTGSSRIITPPDFKGVYGIELNQLEHEWLKWLLLGS